MHYLGLCSCWGLFAWFKFMVVVAGGGHLLLPSICVLFSALFSLLLFLWFCSDKHVTPPYPLPNRCFSKWVSG